MSLWFLLLLGGATVKQYKINISTFLVVLATMANRFLTILGEYHFEIIQVRVVLLAENGRGFYEPMAVPRQLDEWNTF